MNIFSTGFCTPNWPRVDTKNTASLNLTNLLEILLGFFFKKRKIIKNEKSIKNLFSLSRWISRPLLFFWGFFIPSCPRHAFSKAHPLCRPHFLHREIFQMLFSLKKFCHVELDAVSDWHAFKVSVFLSKARLVQGTPPVQRHFCCTLPCLGQGGVSGTPQCGPEGT